MWGMNKDGSKWVLYERCASIQDAQVWIFISVHTFHPSVYVDIRCFVLFCFSF